MSRPENRVERLYREVKEMAARFDFKPGERINESLISARLNVSRTPLREVLNRLAAEGFLTNEPGKGFFCRSLDPREIHDLYEARAALESDAVRLATLRASDTDLHALADRIADARTSYRPGVSAVTLLQADEEFHLDIARLSGNAELVKLLVNINARIHYIRLIDLRTLSESKGDKTLDTAAHQRIVALMCARAHDRAAGEMRRHIEDRLDGVTENVRLAFSAIYMPEGSDV